MSPLKREIGPAALRWELPIVCLLAWLALISIPLSQGAIGLSSDALNHHIYLGWIAESPRFEQDFLAVSYQAYQFPYLYWPIYKLATSGWSGAWAGVVIATLHLAAVPPVWMLARSCMPGRTTFDMAMRVLAVIMAFLTAVVLSLLDSTSNDLLATIPFLWALALALEPAHPGHPRWLKPAHVVVLSGLLAGVAVACKLSNGPLAVLFPGLWIATTAGGWNVRLRLTIAGCAAILAGYVLVYGYWGTQLWSHFGNPIYPFYDHLFSPLRKMAGWAP